MAMVLAGCTTLQLPGDDPDQSASGDASTDAAVGASPDPTPPIDEQDPAPSQPASPSPSGPAASTPLPSEKDVGDGWIFTTDTGPDQVFTTEGSSFEGCDVEEIEPLSTAFVQPGAVARSFVAEGLSLRVHAVVSDDDAAVDALATLPSCGVETAEEPDGTMLSATYERIEVTGEGRVAAISTRTELDAPDGATLVFVGTLVVLQHDEHLVAVGVDGREGADDFDVQPLVDLIDARIDGDLPPTAGESGQLV